MIKPQDLRTGNCLHYKDKGDTYPILNRVDWEDIKWLAQNSKSFNECHKPIHLSPEVLGQWCGFRSRINPDNVTGVFSLDSQHLDLHLDYDWRHKDGFRPMELHNDDWCVYGCSLFYLHQLQNLYFTLCGTELEVKVPSPLHETENK